MAPFTVEVLSYTVREGEYAVYRPLGDEEWYYLEADGRTWKTADRTTELPEMEIAAPTVVGVNRILTRAFAIIANLQEHGGTAIVFVRSLKLEKLETGDVWSFVGCVVMTAKTGEPVREAVKLFDRTIISVEGIPAHLEIDELTVQHLDYLDQVEEVHNL